jgi:lantibiotic modifying enzyme
MHEFGGEAAGFLRLAREAFAFERASYDKVRGWPDLRQSPAQYPLAWCHGAPGVALGRFPLIDLDPQARTEIAEATQRTLAARPLLGHGLCHGQLGNLVIAQEAARLLGRSDLSAQVSKQTSAVLHQLRTRGPRGSVDFAAAAPGLMDGLAGMGLGLLRLSHPEQVPLFQALGAAPKLTVPSPPKGRD